jgi:hypothetical protein
MTGENIVNNKHQENGALTDPQIFTLPRSTDNQARGGFIPSLSNFNKHLGGNPGI